MNKILILCADSNGGYPIPAVRGGAASILVEQLADGNEKKDLCDLTIVSFYDDAAFELAKKYRKTHFLWVKVPRLIKKMDDFLFWGIRKFKKNEKSISFRSLFSLLYYMYKAKGIVNKLDFDNIVIENNIPMALVFKKRRKNYNIFYHLHNIPRIDAKCRDVMKGVKKFICVSQFVANSICSEHSAIGQIPNEKTSILYNCVDTDLFRPLVGDCRIDELRKRLSITASDKVLIFVGRLTEEKGANIVLNAMKKLSSQYKLLIVGSFHYNIDVSSKYQDELKFMANELSNRVIFTGYVPHNDLPLYYNLAYLAVLPSMWDEPAGLTNLEAMACGVPVITTNSGGIPEYIGDSFIFDRDEDLVDNIVRTILELQEDRSLYERKSGESRAFVCSHFDKNDYIDKFINAIVN